MSPTGKNNSSIRVLELFGDPEISRFSEPGIEVSVGDTVDAVLLNALIGAGKVPLITKHESAAKVEKKTKPETKPETTKET